MTNSFRTATSFLVETDMLILKFIWKCEGPKPATELRKDRAGEQSSHDQLLGKPPGQCHPAEQETTEERGAASPHSADFRQKY